MLLIPASTKLSYSPYPPVWGELLYTGEPRRRTWSIKAGWRLVDRKHTVKTNITSAWLSSILDDMATMELDLVRPRAGHFPMPVLNYWTLRVFYPDELFISLRNTIPRYCKHRGMIRLERPKHQ